MHTCDMMKNGVFSYSRTPRLEERYGIDGRKKNFPLQASLVSNRDQPFLHIRLHDIR